MPDVERPYEVRVLDTFVKRMQRELAANSDKGDRAGWMADSLRDLLAEIQHHYVKLHVVVVELDREDHDLECRPTPWGDAGDDLQDLVAEFAAGMATIAMKLADRCGALDVPLTAGDYDA